MNDVTDKSAWIVPRVLAARVSLTGAAQRLIFAGHVNRRCVSA
jgi:hypothetical protein